MNFDNLIDKVSLSSRNVEDLCLVHEDIARLLLIYSQIELKGSIIQLCEIEIYDDANDGYGHNQVRRCEFNRFYVHKRGGTRKGIDIALTPGGGKPLSVLIRSIFVDNKYYIGPCKVAEFFLSKCSDLEELNDVLSEAKDVREDTLILKSFRVGLTDGKKGRYYLDRYLINFKEARDEKKYYDEKETVIECYLRAHNNGNSMDKGALRDLFGYYPAVALAKVSDYKPDNAKYEYDLIVDLTNDNLEATEKWLLEEYTKTQKGFYPEWPFMKDPVKKLIILTKGNECVGFLKWIDGENHIDICNFEIRPEYRNKGIGRIFFERISSYFRQKKFVAFKLYCAPKESEGFWREMGFIPLPDIGFSQPELSFYKLLIDVKEPTDSPDKQNKLELWNSLFPYSGNGKPTWCWNMDLNNIEKPILMPCDPDWRCRWTKDGKIIHDYKVKKLKIKGFQINTISFLYIKKLKE